MTRIYIGDVEVTQILAKMRFPKEVAIDLGSKIAGERANLTEDDPSTAWGYEPWRWGTRFCREDEALKKLGWQRCAKDQVPGIRNAALSLKIIICNTDANTGNLTHTPHNVSERGPTGCRLIGANNHDQSKFEFMTELPRDDVWYFCQHFSDEHILLEISRPDIEIGGFVARYSDRIIIAKPGDIPGVRRTSVPQDFADVPRPRATRKPG